MDDNIAGGLGLDRLGDDLAVFDLKLKCCDRDEAVRSNRFFQCVLAVFQSGDLRLVALEGNFGVLVGQGLALDLYAVQICILILCGQLELCLVRFRNRLRAKVGLADCQGSGFLAVVILQRDRCGLAGHDCCIAAGLACTLELVARNSGVGLRHLVIAGFHAVDLQHVGAVGLLCEFLKGDFNLFLAGLACCVEVFACFVRDGELDCAVEFLFGDVETVDGLGDLDAADVLSVLVFQFNHRFLAVLDLLGAVGLGGGFQGVACQIGICLDHFVLAELNALELELVDALIVLGELTECDLNCLVAELAVSVEILAGGLVLNCEGQRAVELCLGHVLCVNSLRDLEIALLLAVLVFQFDHGFLAVLDLLCTVGLGGGFECVTCQIGVCLDHFVLAELNALERELIDALVVLGELAECDLNCLVAELAVSVEILAGGLVLNCEGQRAVELCFGHVLCVNSLRDLKVALLLAVLVFQFDDRFLAVLNLLCAVGLGGGFQGVACQIGICLDHFVLAELNALEHELIDALIVLGELAERDLNCLVAEFAVSVEILAGGLVLNCEGQRAVELCLGHVLCVNSLRDLKVALLLAVLVFQFDHRFLTVLNLLGSVGLGGRFQGVTCEVAVRLDHFVLAELNALEHELIDALIVLGELAERDLNCLVAEFAVSVEILAGGLVLNCEGQRAVELCLGHVLCVNSLRDLEIALLLAVLVFQFDDGFLAVLNLLCAVGLGGGFQGVACQIGICLDHFVLAELNALEHELIDALIVLGELAERDLNCLVAEFAVSVEILAGGLVLNCEGQRAVELCFGHVLCVNSLRDLEIAILLAVLIFQLNHRFLAVLDLLCAVGLGGGFQGVACEVAVCLDHFVLAEFNALELELIDALVILRELAKCDLNCLVAELAVSVEVFAGGLVLNCEGQCAVELCFGHVFCVNSLRDLEIALLLAVLVFQFDDGFLAVLNLLGSVGLGGRFQGVTCEVAVRLDHFVLAELNALELELIDALVILREGLERDLDCLVAEFAVSVEVFARGLVLNCEGQCAVELCFGHVFCVNSLRDLEIALLLAVLVFQSNNRFFSGGHLSSSVSFGSRFQRVASQIGICLDDFIAAECNLLELELIDALCVLCKRFERDLNCLVAELAVRIKVLAGILILDRELQCAVELCLCNGFSVNRFFNLEAAHCSGCGGGSCCCGCCRLRCRFRRRSRGRLLRCRSCSCGSGGRCGGSCSGGCGSCCGCGSCSSGGCSGCSSCCGGSCCSSSRGCGGLCHVVDIDHRAFDIVIACVFTGRLRGLCRGISLDCCKTVLTDGEHQRARCCDVILGSRSTGFLEFILTLEQTADCQRAFAGGDKCQRSCIVSTLRDNFAAVLDNHAAVELNLRILGSQNEGCALEVGDRVIRIILLVQLEGVALLLILDDQRLACVLGFDVGLCKLLCFCAFLGGHFCDIAVSLCIVGNNLAVLDNEGELCHGDVIFDAVLFLRRSSLCQTVGAVAQRSDIDLAALEGQLLAVDVRLFEHGHRGNLADLCIDADCVLSAVREADDISAVIEACNHELVAGDLTAVHIIVLARCSCVIVQDICISLNILSIAANLNVLEGVAADFKGLCIFRINDDGLVIVVIAVFIVIDLCGDAFCARAALADCKIAELNRLVVIAELFEGKGCILKGVAAHILFADGKRDRFVSQGNGVIVVLGIVLADGLELAGCRVALDAEGSFRRKESERGFHFFNSIVAFRQSGEDYRRADGSPAIYCCVRRLIPDQVLIILQQIVRAVVSAGAVCKEELAVACLDLREVDRIAVSILAAQFKNRARNRHIVLVDLSDADRVDRVINRRGISRSTLCLADADRSRIRAALISICAGDAGIGDIDLYRRDRLIALRSGKLLKEIIAVREFAEFDIGINNRPADGLLGCIESRLALSLGFLSVKVRGYCFQRALALIGQLHFRTGDLLAAADCGIVIAGNGAELVAVRCLCESDLVLDRLCLVWQLDGHGCAVLVDLDFRIADPCRCACALIYRIADCKRAVIVILMNLSLCQRDRFCVGQHERALRSIILSGQVAFCNDIGREPADVRINHFSICVLISSIDRIRTHCRFYGDALDILDLVAFLCRKLIAFFIAENVEAGRCLFKDIRFNGIRCADRNSLVSVDGEVLLDVQQGLLVACRSRGLYYIVCTGLKLERILAVHNQGCDGGSGDLSKRCRAVLLPELECCILDKSVGVFVDLAELNLGVVALIADKEASVRSLVDIELCPAAVRLDGDVRLRYAPCAVRCCIKNRHVRRSFALANLGHEVDLAACPSALDSCSSDQDIVGRIEIALRSLRLGDAVDVTVVIAGLGNAADDIGIKRALEVLAVPCESRNAALRSRSFPALVGGGFAFLFLGVGFVHHGEVSAGQCLRLICRIDLRQCECSLISELKLCFEQIGKMEVCCCNLAVSCDDIILFAVVNADSRCEEVILFSRSDIRTGAVRLDLKDLCHNRAFLAVLNFNGIFLAADIVGVLCNCQRRNRRCWFL